MQKGFQSLRSKLRKASRRFDGTVVNVVSGLTDGVKGTLGPGERCGCGELLEPPEMVEVPEFQTEWLGEGSLSPKQSTSLVAEDGVANAPNTASNSATTQNPDWWKEQDYYLCIAVKEARNLAMTDFEFRSTNTRVQVLVWQCPTEATSGIKESHSSRICNRNRNPMWQERFLFPMSGMTLDTKVQLSVMGRVLGRDTFAGQIQMKLGYLMEQIQSPMESYSRWYRLGRRRTGDRVSGDLHFSATVVPRQMYEIVQPTLLGITSPRVLRARYSPYALKLTFHGLTELRSILSSSEALAQAVHNISIDLRLGQKSLVIKLNPKDVLQSASESIKTLSLALDQTVYLPLENCFDKNAPAKMKSRMRLKKPDVADIKLYVMVAKEVVCKTQVPIWDVPLSSGVDFDKDAFPSRALSSPLDFLASYSGDSKPATTRSRFSASGQLSEDLSFSHAQMKNLKEGEEESTAAEGSADTAPRFALLVGEDAELLLSDLEDKEDQNTEGPLSPSHDRISPALSSRPSPLARDSPGFPGVRISSVEEGDEGGLGDDDDEEEHDNGLSMRASKRSTVDGDDGDGQTTPTIGRRLSLVLSEGAQRSLGSSELTTPTAVARRSLTITSGGAEGEVAGSSADGLSPKQARAHTHGQELVPHPGGASLERKKTWQKRCPICVAVAHSLSLSRRSNAMPGVVDRPKVEKHDSAKESMSHSTSPAAKPSLDLLDMVNLDAMVPGHNAVVGELGRRYKRMMEGSYCEDLIGFPFIEFSLQVVPRKDVPSLVQTTHPSQTSLERDSNPSLHSHLSHPTEETTSTTIDTTKFVPISFPEPLELPIIDLQIDAIPATILETLHSPEPGSFRLRMMQKEALQEIKHGAWAAAPDVSPTSRTRKVGYIRPLNIPLPMAPKQTNVVEVQTLTVEEAGGFVLETKVTNDATKGDCYFVLIQHAATWDPVTNKTRVRASFKFETLKSLGLLRGPVENGAKKDTKSGVATWLRELSTHLAAATAVVKGTDRSAMSSETLSSAGTAGGAAAPAQHVLAGSSQVALSPSRSKSLIFNLTTFEAGLLLILALLVIAVFLHSMAMFRMAGSLDHLSKMVEHRWVDNIPTPISTKEETVRTACAVEEVEVEVAVADVFDAPPYE